MRCLPKGSQGSDYRRPRGYRTGGSQAGPGHLKPEASGIACLLTLQTQKAQRIKGLCVYLQINSTWGVTINSLQTNSTSAKQESKSPCSTQLISLWAAHTSLLLLWEYVLGFHFYWTKGSSPLHVKISFSLPPSSSPWDSSLPKISGLKAYASCPF